MLFRNAISQAKADVSRAVSARQEAYAWAQQMLKPIEEARTAIRIDLAIERKDREPRESEIAEWLNQNGIRPKGRQAENSKWSRVQLGKTVFRADERMIENAVLECRTRMTVMALSADFAKPVDMAHSLELEYLELIADALELGHRLRGERSRSREELMNDARHAAVDVARRQRANKPVSMAARERLWEDYAPIVRKVFTDFGP